MQRSFVRGRRDGVTNASHGKRLRVVLPRLLRARLAAAAVLGPRERGSRDGARRYGLSVSDTWAAAVSGVGSVRDETASHSMAERMAVGEDGGTVSVTGGAVPSALAGLDTPSARQIAVSAHEVTTRTTGCQPPAEGVTVTVPVDPVGTVIR